ncbi:MAG: alpha-L-fucosidase [Clostridia bacterium]|nr:alpha-L-fucosidase [Clostridia bacterium]
MKDSEIIKRANSIAPSKAQMDFCDLEFIALVPFGMNTYTNSETGTGREPEKYFNPPELDAAQWVRTIKNAGMKALVLTCKYSDGFCIWPSEYTDYSVKNSPWLEGNGDVVRLVSDECQKAGIKFGIYISPYDMHEKTFGTDEYNTYFVNQLKELLTNYGDICCVWLPRDNKTNFHYNWAAYYETIRELQPNAVIIECGPDIRWVGNSGGFARKQEWNVVPYNLLNNAPVKRLVEQDLGSRRVIKKAKELVWFPPITYSSIRKGWFYHQEEGTDLKMLSNILEIYFRSVGNNGMFALSIPPSHLGKIDSADVDSLTTLGIQLTLEFKENFAKDGQFTASSERDELHSAKMADEGKSYWSSKEDDDNITLTLDMGKVNFINKIVLGENTATGQQIEKFNLYYYFDKKWNKIYSGKTIGRKKICNLPPMNARRIKLEVKKTRGFATIKTFEVY